MMRAILLANATRTSIGGLRATIRAIHDPAGAPLRATHSKTLFAPMISKRLGVPMPCTRAVYACAKLLDEHRARRVTPKAEGVAS